MSWAIPLKLELGIPGNMFSRAMVISQSREAWLRVICQNCGVRSMFDCSRGNVAGSMYTFSGRSEYRFVCQLIISFGGLGGNGVAQLNVWFCVPFERRIGSSFSLLVCGW